MHQCVHSSQDMENIHGQVDGPRGCGALYTVAYYSAIKKNGLMPFEATWIKLEIIILSEEVRNESWKDK